MQKQFGPMEGVQYTEVGPFRLSLRRAGDEWAWSVFDSWSDEILIFGTAPSMEKAQEAAEEIVGRKSDWQSTAA